MQKISTLIMLLGFVCISLTSQSLSKLVLINATTDAEIRDMATTGEVINMDDNPLINFRAVTDPEPLASGKCVFKLTYPDGQVYNHSEGTAVYACFGDNSGNYLDWANGFDSPPAIQKGDYTLEVTPGTGTASTYNFTIEMTVPDNGGETGLGEPLDVANGEVLVTGEEKQWHNVTLNFGGPEADEVGTDNPFSNYRLEVTFSKGNTSLKVPGYYAADGNAGETAATTGNIWKVHFCPAEVGEWSYAVSFRKGTDVAISDDVNAGEAEAPIDGKTGTLTIEESDKTGRDFRAKGRLTYEGEHHLQFAGSGQWFMKAGPDAPENFLAYEDFDNTTNNGGYRKNWSAHIADWKQGDPVWRDSKGKGIIGAVNYLASKGLNVVSFLTISAPQGDDKNVFMWINTNTKDRFDCSKLDQWEVVFTHAQKKGLYLHFKTSETENEMMLDNGDVGRYRKLYYRELIARYGHHLALNWNLGEENGHYGNTNQNTQQRKDMAAYFKDHDPYQNHIVIHTAPDKQEEIYRPLLGDNSELTGVSIQTDWQKVHTETAKWVTESANTSKKWVVANDEQGSAKIGVPEDAYTGTPNKDNIREKVLWGNMMAGGAGVEYYFGYERPHSDLNCQDYRSRDMSWDYCRNALSFFNMYVPYWEMLNDNSKTTSGYCLYKDAEVYVVYLPNGGSTNVNLASGTYNVSWYNPRDGGALTDGKTSVTGGGAVSIGAAPDSSNDWVALIREENFEYDSNDVELYPCGDDIVFASISDFENTNVDGFHPAYKDNGNNCLAIDATQYKDAYAAANTTFDEATGFYNITLTTLTETDGESSYRLRIGNQLIGEYQNPESDVDYAPSTYTWEQVEINNGDVVQIEFSSHTNGKIPEGNSTAYSRGRWTQLAFTPMCSEPCDGSDAYMEKDGVVVIEMEHASVLNQYWTIQTGAGSLGDGYIQYEGPDHMNAHQDNKTMTYNVQISTPGTYQFLWKTRRGFNSQSFDGANDSWLKINADDFYGMKNGSKVECKGDFMKVWIQKDEFSLDCWGEHHGQNSLVIYAQFDVAGEYTIDVSGRSQGHVIDRMALFMDGKKAIATDNTTPESETGCGGNSGPVYTAVEDMYMAYDTIYVFAEDDYQMRHTILPDHASEKDLIWTSESSGIVDVSEDGLISPKSEGKAYIKAISKDYEAAKDSCFVVVLKNEKRNKLDKSSWKVIYADSEAEGSTKDKALDGDLSTFWHTEWKDAKPALPHEIHIDLIELKQIDFIDYYSRQDEWGPNGSIGTFEIYVSEDKDNWGTPVKKDYIRWAKNATKEDYKDMRRIFLDETAKGRYLKIKALSEAQNDASIPFTAIAEIDLWSYENSDISIGSIYEHGIEVYPNPLNDQMFIKSSGQAISSLDLYQMDGRSVISRNDSSWSFNLETDHLYKGSYVLKLILQDGTIISHKVLKR